MFGHKSYVVFGHKSYIVFGHKSYIVFGHKSGGSSAQNSHGHGVDTRAFTHCINHGRDVEECFSV